MTQILFFINAGALVLFGVYLTVAFTGIQFTRKNFFLCLGFCATSGLLQLLAYIFTSPSYVWKIYPVIAHIPLLLLLVFVFHQRLVTAAVSICTAYLCCQPAKWFGVLAATLTQSTVVEYIVRIILLCITFSVTYIFLSRHISEIYNKDTRSVCIFGITPVIYYLFDYIVVIYTNFWTTYASITAEFLAFFLCIIFLVFCVVYYKEYEQKANAQQQELIISLIIDEQKKELETIKRNEQEIRILRHDMRLLLLTLSMAVENDDKETAKKMIASYISGIDATTIKKYCQNTTINYVISAFARKCEELQIELLCQINISELACDETILSSIISNALDNAVHAQEQLPLSQRKIELMLKNMNGKLLFSTKNTFKTKPVLVNGIPKTNHTGHGYGSQSIAYLTERLGGICQFTIDGNYFIVRVII